MSDQEDMERPRTLLAVDLGLRLGLAAYAETGELLWYRSQHFGKKAQLKRGAYNIIQELENFGALILEGDRGLGSAFAKIAQKRDVPFLYVSAEQWREQLMPPRHRRSGEIAKAYADTLARQIIEESNAARPTSLRHDAAEAILAGYWGLRAVGWVEDDLS